MVELRAGATATSNLVTDVIVEPLSTRPAVAPTFGMAVGTRLDSLYTVHVTGAWTRSDVKRYQRGTVTPVIAVSTWQGSVELRRRITPLIIGHAMVGVLKYAPGSDGRGATLFRGDAPAVPTLGIGASLGRSVTPTLHAALHVAWDLHRFTTAALRATGFEGRRTVHRVFFGATIRREANPATP